MHAREKGGPGDEANDDPHRPLLLTMSCVLCHIHVCVQFVGPRTKPKSPHSLPPLLDKQKSISAAIHAYKFYEPIKIVKSKYVAYTTRG